MILHYTGATNNVLINENEWDTQLLSFDDIKYRDR